MPAMRLFDSNERIQELNRLGLIKIDGESPALELWKDNDGNIYPLNVFPPGDKYPDFYFDEIFKMIKRTENLKP